MSEKIIKAMVEGRFLNATFKKVKSFFTKIRKTIDKRISIPAIHLYTRKVPVEDDKIIFLTFRSEYDCNAKWISLEMLKRDLPYKLVWAKGKKVSEELFPEGLILTNRGSFDFFRHLASAKIIVDNGISTAHLRYKKKKNQYLIETWHGSLGIKKFSKDTVNDKRWVKKAFKEGEMTDFIISNSTFEDAVYREDYWKNTPIWQYGHARNDILLEKDTERLKNIKAKVYEMYNLEDDVKICLYAPTFRDDGDMRPYEIDYANLQNALETRFGGKWVIFTRFHFRLRNKLKNYKYSEGVINASDYPDIQELMSCIDVGITDYSSWICDYMLRRKPGFLFATDMDEYQREDRSFFYPLSTMPFPLAVNNEQLIENILNFNNEKFIEDCESFLDDKGCMDDGHASERIVDAIERLFNSSYKTN